MSWELVIASRGASNHKEMLDGFIEHIDSASERDERGCQGAVELAQLKFDASTLNVLVTAQGEGADEDYATVAGAGNAWVERVGAEDQKFAAQL